MPLNTETDVLVIGAGPVGLALASELTRHRAQCRIIDQADGPSTTSKAIAIHARTLEVLSDMGIAEPMLAAGIKIRKASISADGKVLAHFNFEEIDSPYPFILDLSQAQTERFLIGHLERLGGHVERGKKLTGFTQDESGVTATLQLSDGSTEMVRAQYLAGCDGAHSEVRQQVGAAFEGSAYPAFLILGDVKLEWDGPNDEFRMFLHADGLLACFPLPDGRARLIADVTTSVHDDKTPEPTFEDLQRIFTERASVEAKLSDPVWLSGFRIHHRKVKQYRHGRVFLAGDAAHIHSPAGGQGMNTGIQDAHNLAWKLALALRNRATPALLDSYSAEREPVAAHVIALTDRMTKMAAARSRVAQEARNLLLPLISGTRLFQRTMTREISEAGIHYRESPVVSQRGRFHCGPEAGEHARTFDGCDSARHNLLLFGDCGSIREFVERRYAAEIVTHCKSAPDPQFGSVSHGVYLVRPDGYVGFRSAPPHEDALRKHLEGVFSPIAAAAQS